MLDEYAESPKLRQPSHDGLDDVPGPFITITEKRTGLFRGKIVKTVDTQ
ncbi:MAG TPA: hypothetical protein VKF36_07365 [Syntrophorhabdales bacterium]|nr:hypothetical protein [Syntrophorhabdales bacterium]